MCTKDYAVQKTMAQLQRKDYFGYQVAEKYIAIKDINQRSLTLEVLDLCKIFDVRAIENALKKGQNDDYVI